MLTINQRNYLKDLAKSMKEIACSQKELNKVEKFKRINMLNPDIPPVYALLPVKAMKDLNLFKGLILTDEFYRGIESMLIYEINKSHILDSDMPVTDVIYTGLAHSVSEWMDGHKIVRMKDDFTTTAFTPCIKHHDDLSKMQKPILSVDHDKTNQWYEMTADVLGDVLHVRKGKPFSMTKGWGESMIDELAEMRGLEQIYYDMEDSPEFVHAAMRFMTDAKIELLRQYVQEKALFLNIDKEMIGSCSFPFTNKLPGIEYNSDNVLPKNLWGFGQAQEFAGVSPDMLEEFILPYQSELLNQFGLVVYGCCEPMDIQIDLIGKYIHNLRILSISPYSNYKIAAEKCKGKYVMACKVHPSVISQFDENYYEKYITNIIKELSGCCVTFAIAEVIDYGDDPQTFIKAIQIAKKVMEEHYQ